MFPNMNPKKMEAVMKQMGISQENIDSSRVIIEPSNSDGKKIIIENPSVVKIKMQGQENFQISGDIREESAGISEDDIKTVAEKANCTEEEAKNALERTKGDLAEAILELS